MPRREAAIGAAVVAGVGVLSLPVAVALNADRAWWDYRAWRLVRQGRGDHVRLDARVRAARLVAGGRHGAEREVRPAALLEGRGARLVRRPALGPLRRGRRQPLRTRGGVLRARIPEGRWDYNEYNPDWDERIRFTVRSLSSTMVVGAGITLRVDGVGGARPSSDGTTRLRPGGNRWRRATRTSSALTRRIRPRPRWRSVQEGYPRRPDQRTPRSSCPTPARPRPTGPPGRRRRARARGAWARQRLRASAG